MLPFGGWNPHKNVLLPGGSAHAMPVVIASGVGRIDCLVRVSNFKDSLTSSEAHQVPHELGISHSHPCPVSYPTPSTTLPPLSPLPFPSRAPPRVPLPVVERLPGWAASLACSWHRRPDGSGILPHDFASVCRCRGWLCLASGFRIIRRVALVVASWVHLERRHGLSRRLAGRGGAACGLEDGRTLFARVIVQQVGRMMNVWSLRRFEGLLATLAL